MDERKCKFCGSEDKEKLIIISSTDKNGHRYEDGHACLKCLAERNYENSGLQN